MAINHVRRGGAGLAAVALVAVSVLSACGTVEESKADSSKSAAPTNSFCTGAGVNVVVDFGAAGGGVKKGCGQGATAQAAITAAGFKLGLKSSSFGPFTCTVDGIPADKQCDGKPAYWGLFLGKGTSWDYATKGVSTQDVKDGQTIALAWQTSTTAVLPSVAPAAK